MKRAKPFLAPDLYARIWKKLNQPVAKGDAPDIEGDVFLNGEEPPTHFTLGKTTIEGDKARVDVALTWPEEKRQYTVFLRQIDGAWKVTDIDFGKKGGTLSDLIK